MSISGKQSKGSCSQDSYNASEWEAILKSKKGKAVGKLHMFSPTIAQLINEKQPDITAAALFYNLSLWQKNNYNQTLIEGRRYAFRSLTELTQDCPYIGRSAIAKAILRMEKALGEKFRVKRDETKLWYSISDALLGKQKKNHLLSFRSDEAVYYDCVRTAVLLNNARYAFHVFKDFKQDANGNKYIPMRPATLAHYLPFSEDSIQRSLTQLCEETGRLMRHPESRHYYAVRSDEVASVSTENAKNPFADVHAATAKVHDTTAGVHSSGAKLHNRGAEVHASVGTDSNECRITESLTSDVTRDINGNPILQSTSSPQDAVLGISISSGMKALLQDAEIRIKELAKSNGKSAAPRVDASQLPYDTATPIWASELDSSKSCHDLPYDMIHLEIRFTERLQDQIDAMLLHWKLDKFPYDQEDVRTLEKFFVHNFNLPDDLLLNLWREAREYQRGNDLGQAPKVKKGKFDPYLFARTARTAKAFLKNLPKIVYQKFMDYEYKGAEILTKSTIEKPFDEISYAYLEKKPKGSFLPESLLPLPVEVVPDDHENVT